MRNELELVEKKSLREELIERTEVLDKVKEVVLLPYGECMNLNQVSDYYEVLKDTVKKTVTRHLDELTNNGMTRLNGENLKEFKSHFDGDTLSLTKMNKTNRELLIFTRRAILNIGMLLQESPIAKEIRTKLLDMSETKEAINNVVNDITEEQKLMLAIMCAKDDMERMVAMNALKRYKDEKEAKIKEEKDIAVGKVINLTKSDATFTLRETKTNIGCGERNLSTYLIENKYCYRQNKSDGTKGKLKPYAEYSKEPTRYFTEVTNIGRDNNPHTSTVFTIDGVEYFRKLKSKIEE